MSIHFTCKNSSCAKSVRAPDAAAGKKARCPYCGTVQGVPASAAESQKTSPQADDDGGSLLSHIEFTPPSASVPAPPRPIERSKRPYAIAAIAAVGVIVLVIAIVVMMNANSSKKAKQSAWPEAGAVDGGDAQPIPPIAGEEPPAAPQPAAVREPAPAGNAAASPSGNSPAANNLAARFSAPQEAAPSPSPAQSQPPVPQTAVPPANNSQQNSGDVKILPTAVPVVVQPIDAPAAYITVVTGAKAIAQMQTSKSDMDGIKKAIQMYAMMHDEKWPNSFDDLLKDNLLSDNKMLMSVAKQNTRKIFISGQGPDSPPKNIVVYDPVAYQGEKVVVLLVDGTATWLTPDELKAQLAAQKAKPEENPPK